MNNQSISQAAMDAAERIFRRFVSANLRSDDPIKVKAESFIATMIDRVLETERAELQRLRVMEDVFKGFKNPEITDHSSRVQELEIKLHEERAELIAKAREEVLAMDKARLSFYDAMIRERDVRRQLAEALKVAEIPIRKTVSSGQHPATVLDVILSALAASRALDKETEQ